MTDRLETADEQPAGDHRARVDAAPAADPDPSPDDRLGRHGRVRSVATDLVVILGSYLLLGVLCGLLWWLLVDPAMFTKSEGGGGAMGELELSNRFNGDGWYAVIGAVAGLVSGVLLTWWRSRDFLLTTVLLLLGTAVAAAVMAVTGHWLGPGDPDAALAAVQVGDQVPVQLEVTAKATYLVWPMAALVGALVVLWSPPRDDTA